MSLLAIALPLPLSVVPDQSSAGSGLRNVLTPNPKEAFVASAAGPIIITVDLGSIMPVDSFLLGFTNAIGADTVQIRAGNDLSTVVYAGSFSHSYRRAPMRHAIAVLDRAIETRFVQIVTNTAGPIVVGVVAVGLSIRPSLGFDYGWGRPISDAGRVDRLLGGGLGSQPGGVAGGLQWTMPALTDIEREQLYALSLDAGTTTTLLVVEDPDAGPALNERIHWGCATKLEPFARQQPGESKWTMQIQDWA